MDDLIAFLKARLDEDEQAARAAHGPNWNAEKRDVAYGDEWIMSALTQADAAHIARHDPARVLREVAVKQRIVATYTELDAHPNRLSYAFIQQQWVALRAVIAALALAHADHPDYQAEEWKP